MVIAFANNQTMIAIHGTATTIYTDPVPLNGNDRCCCIATVHSIFSQGGTPDWSYRAQVSNDGGQNFVDVSGVNDSFTATGTDKVVGVTAGSLLRFKFVLNITPGGSALDIAGCCIDLHVNLDHA